MESRGLNNDEPLRRIRSMGDIHPDPFTRPPRSHIGSSNTRRSDGQSSRSTGGVLYPGIDRSAATPNVHLEVPDRRDEQTPPPLAWTLPPIVHEEPRPTNPTSPAPPAERTGWIGVLMTFFGYSGTNARAKRELFSLAWNLAFALGQFIVIVTFLVISAHHKSPSPNKGNMSEWVACDKPLGAWNIIWLIRVALGGILSYWGWKRDRTLRLAQEQRERNRDAEAARTTLPTTFLDTYSRSNNATAARGTSGRDGRPATSLPETANQLPHSHLYSRLSLLTSILSLVWFLTAHILEYTSINTCRVSSPHLWWLTFGILCILYIMILEIFLLGLLVFILGPILYLVWNIVLLCLGRHPVQRPHHINPEVGKLSKSVVDQIPLVLYIPAPPEGETDSNGKPITIPPEAYSYPPKQQSPAPRKRRFVFLRRSKKSKKDHNSLTTGDKKDNGKSDDDGPKKWEDNWEHGEYPFVVLEGNRAACAICLMDFEEPKRTQQSEENKDKPQTHVEDEKKDSESPVNGGEVNAEAGAAGDIVEEARPTTTVREDLARLMLEDAGEGPQPLRLLPCGHVFHQTCVDPWLTDVSGRCPVCQRPVDLKKLDGGRRSDPSRRENER